MSTDVEEAALYAADISEILDEPIDDCLRFFSGERKRAILCYRAASDRSRAVFAELLARKALAEASSIPIDKILIARDERGKPAAPGSGLFVSLSHSGGWVACAVGKSEVGVDVEHARKNFSGVAKRFFAAEEYERLKSLSGADFDREFLRYWTLKESYLKYTGEGLAGGLARVSCEALLLGIGGAVGANFPLPDGSMLGVCAKNSALIKEPVFVSVAEIVSFFNENFP